MNPTKRCLYDPHIWVRVHWHLACHEGEHQHFSLVDSSIQRKWWNKLFGKATTCCHQWWVIPLTREAYAIEAGIALSCNLRWFEVLVTLDRRDLTGLNNSKGQLPLVVSSTMLVAMRRWGWRQPLSGELWSCRLCQSSTVRRWRVKIGEFSMFVRWIIFL
jgi:hypothetical protein